MPSSPFWYCCVFCCLLAGESARLAGCAAQSHRLCPRCSPPSLAPLRCSIHLRRRWHRRVVLRAEALLVRTHSCSSVQLERVADQRRLPSSAADRVSDVIPSVGRAIGLSTYIGRIESPQHATTPHRIKTADDSRSNAGLVLLLVGINRLGEFCVRSASKGASTVASSGMFARSGVRLLGQISIAQPPGEARANRVRPGHRFAVTEHRIAGWAGCRRNSARGRISRY